MLGFPPRNFLRHVRQHKLRLRLPNPRPRIRLHRLGHGENIFLGTRFFPSIRHAAPAQSKSMTHFSPPAYCSSLKIAGTGNRIENRAK